MFHGSVTVPLYQLLLERSQSPAPPEFCPVGDQARVAACAGPHNESANEIVALRPIFEREVLPRFLANSDATTQHCLATLQITQ
ncbi:hypothetical protein D3C80_1639930 [compost metagenome]